MKTPIVVGHLKPVILLPAGLVTGLTQDEVEALLAHELAHIGRKDYLLNIGQSLIDILYFFHPGIRWISANVRQEREHCCDDVAVALCGDSQNYAKALAHLQVGETSRPQPSLAATGRTHGLLRRLMRLLSPPRLIRDFQEGFVSALILVFCLFGVLKMIGAAIPAEKSGKPSQSASEISPTSNRFAVKAFILEEEGTVELAGKLPDSIASQANTWIIDDQNGQVVWFMTLSGNKKETSEISFAEPVFLPRGSYLWYLPSGCTSSARIESAKDRGQWTPLNLAESAEKSLSNLESLEKERQLLITDEARLKEVQEKMQQAEVERLAREEERQRLEEQLMKEKEGQLKAEQEKMTQKQDQLQAEKLRLQLEEARLKIEEMNFKKFTDELAREGLISEKEGYRIKLSAAGLVINGRKQPPAIFEKYKKLYESLTGKKIEGTRTVTIINDVD